MRATIEDVAKLADVSIATVSRYTSGQSSLISPATQERLREAVARLNYVPNAAARSLKTGRTKLIGVILADVTHDYWSAMLGGIEAGSREAGYGVLICSAHNNPHTQHEYLESLLRHDVEGILINPSPGDGENAPAWRRVRVPVIALDRELTENQFPVVSVDNWLGGALAARHLLACGHREVAILSWKVAGLSNRQERLDGFLQTMQDAGIVVPDSNISLVDERSEDAIEGAIRLMSTTQRPTAVFATNMELSLQAMTAFRQLELRIPDDVSIVGFDDPAWAPLVEPPLTTVATPAFRIGKLAALRLVRATRRQSGAGLRNSQLAPALIKRASVLRLPGSPVVWPSTGGREAQV